MESLEEIKQKLFTDNLTVINKDIKCPHCGELLNGHSGIDHKSMPQEDDYSVCGLCCKLAIFNKDLSLRVPTEEDIKEMQLDPEQWNELHKYIYYAKEIRG